MQQKALLAAHGQGCAGKPNSAQAQAGAWVCCYPFFLGMVLSPAISTLADDVEARFVEQHWPGTVRNRQCGKTYLFQGKCERASIWVWVVLIFVFRAREWALLALFISMGIELEISLLNLGCSWSWLTLFDWWILHNGRASSGWPERLVSLSHCLCTLFWYRKYSLLISTSLH